MEYLSNAGKIDVYAFVIMSNHIHLIWRTNELNGKETAQGSFLKYTAHEFRKMLCKEGRLGLYKVDAENKKHEFFPAQRLRRSTRKLLFRPASLPLTTFPAMSAVWRYVCWQATLAV